MFHDPTTGASNDIEKATAIARKMVTEYGMSAEVGSVKLGQGGRRAVPRPRHGPAAATTPTTIAETIDAEVRKLIEQAHDEAWQVLNDQPRHARQARHRAAREGDARPRRARRPSSKVEKLPERPQWLSSDKRPVSDRPPVAMPSKAPIDPGVVDGGVESEPERPEAHAAPAQAPASRPPKAAHGHRLRTHRGGRGRTPRRDRRGPRRAGPRRRRRGGSPRRTPTSSPGSARIRSPTSPRPAGARRRTGELVLLRDIEFRSICEHHLLPFTRSRARRLRCPAAASSDSASSRAWSRRSHRARSCRSASPRRSPTRSRPAWSPRACSWCWMPCTAASRPADHGRRGARR